MAAVTYHDPSEISGADMPQTSDYPPVLDTAMVERRPEYPAYIATTPAFVPGLRWQRGKRRREADGA